MRADAEPDGDREGPAGQPALRPRRGVVRPRHRQPAAARTSRPGTRACGRPRRCLFRRHELKVPKAYEDSTIRVKAPIALDMVNSIVAAMTINPPAVQFEPIAGGSEAQNNAELREKFFTASLGPPGAGGGPAAVPGLDVEPGRLRRGRGQDGRAQAQRLGRVPAGVQGHRQGRPHVPAGRGAEGQGRGQEGGAVPDQVDGRAARTSSTTGWGRAGTRYASEIKSVPYLDCLARFDAGLSSNGSVVPEEDMGLPRSQWPQVMSGLPTVDLVELWDWEWCHYAVVGPGQAADRGRLGKGTIVRSVRHGYGIPQTKTLRGPYFRAGGVTTGTRDPETMSLGVLFGFLDLFKLYDQLLTLSSNAAFMTGYPAYKRNAPPGASMASAIGAGAGPHGGALRDRRRGAGRPAPGAGGPRRGAAVRRVARRAAPDGDGPAEGRRAGAGHPEPRPPAGPDRAGHGHLRLPAEPVGVPGGPALLAHPEERRDRPGPAGQLRVLADRGAGGGDRLRLGRGAPGHAPPRATTPAPGAPGRAGWAWGRTT